VEAFWLRLKQRKLVQWAAAYVAAAFALIQVLDVVAQRFGWPDRVEKLIILALAVGFCLVLVLAWYHGERGAQRIGGTELLIIALLLAIGGGLLWRYARQPATAALAKVAAHAAAPPAIAAIPLPVSAASIPEKSVAVLPFANDSGQKDQQYFSDGLSDDLINALSQFAGLKVISRNSAFQFRGSKDSSAKIGQLLGVAHLLEGSVQRAGDEVRITATLVNAGDGSIVWSQRYDKPYKDLFALQDAITTAVAGALKAKLLTAPGAVLQSDRPPGGNLEAYTAYQHGIAYVALNTEAGFHQAIDAFNEAIRLDPRYAAAYAQLSRMWTGLAIQFLTDPARIAQARAAARQASATALKLDPDSALAHWARAYLLQGQDMDWTGAEAESRRALQLAPGDAAAQFGLGEILATLGRNARAVALTRQALAGDPRHATWYNWLGIYLAALGKLDEARTASATAIALQPGAANYHEQLATIAILQGQPAVALAAAQAEPPGIWREIALALALQIGPDRAAADAALGTLIQKYANAAPYQIAEVYALRRDPDHMFKWLDRAWALRDPGIGLLLMDSLILRYQHDPRFAAFCKKVGLPTTTDAVAMKL
jgi:TolB-like protein/Flp pilus assembly protein TadD